MRMSGDVLCSCDMDVCAWAVRVVGGSRGVVVAAVVVMMGLLGWRCRVCSTRRQGAGRYWQRAEGNVTTKECVVACDGDNEGTWGRHARRTRGSRT